MPLDLPSLRGRRYDAGLSAGVLAKNNTPLNLESAWKKQYATGTPRVPARWIAADSENVVTRIDTTHHEGKGSPAATQDTRARRLTAG